MAYKINNPKGNVDITDNSLATIVGKAVTDCYGVVGMVSHHEFHDGVSHILHRPNYSKGITITQVHHRTIIFIYIMVQYGVKVSEVAKSIQNKVAFQLKSMLGLDNAQINIVVQSIDASNHKK